MDYHFWDTCWQRASQPFHLSEAHPFLRRYLYLLDNKEKLLLPLSGKSVDPIFLAQNNIHSTSIEFNPSAIDNFIIDSELSFKRKTFEQKKCYDFGDFDIWLADFFDIETKDIGKFSQVFDRAALVALPKELRDKYIKHLKSLLQPKATILMVTMDYEEGEMSGPPFYIAQNELTELFPESSIRELDRISLINNHHRWKELQLSKLDEVLFQINFNDLKT
ncbi:thiopurine S-methyltransferase [Kangiella sp. HZ709]|uniref:thiopurine S-methyltransferase n=1 Tax=Kangiella sp. HZ709 TaxID=2666328 RepID=UPI0012B13D25|nr:thiopurine S-methyltransferase [Kangiella sp. HZ709]MRX28461.1 thiopurine S-methyltransferase [Kangiella sp. HZ709]